MESLITALLILAAAFQASQPSYPVRWTRAVGPPSRRVLKAKLKMPVNHPPGQRMYEHTGRKREIRTCVDYLRAKRNNWSDEANGFERATEGFFKEQCYAPLLILAARPSRISYVKNFKLNEAALDLLPPSMSFTPVGELEEKADEAERQGLSWKKFKPGLKLLKKGADWIAVEEPSESRIELHIKAFGDFNGDGVEDVLLFKSDRAIGGTFHADYPVVLTRVVADGPLKAFEINDADVEKAATAVMHAGPDTGPKRAGQKRANQWRKL